MFPVIMVIEGRVVSINVRQGNWQLVDLRDDQIAVARQLPKQGSSGGGRAGGAASLDEERMQSQTWSGMECVTVAAAVVAAAAAAGIKLESVALNELQMIQGRTRGKASESATVDRSSLQHPPDRQAVSGDQRPAEQESCS